MPKGALILPFLMCAVAFAQLDSNSITVTASNNTSLQPDQAVFLVAVQSPSTTGFEDVLTALQGSGITAANFTGVSTLPQLCATVTCGLSPSPLQWSFGVTAPITNTKATVASLTTLQQNIAKANDGLTMSFSLIGTQVSQQLAASQTCSLSNLITSATTQAQNLANAGGVTLGPVIAMAGSTANVASSQQYLPVGPYVSSVLTTGPPPCSITVKFGLTRH